jgi:hypothetical protein
VLPATTIYPPQKQSAHATTQAGYERGPRTEIKDATAHILVSKPVLTANMI